MLKIKGKILVFLTLMMANCATPTPIPLLSLQAPPSYAITGERVEGRACYYRNIPSRQAYIEGHYFGVGPDTLDYAWAFYDAIENTQPTADGLIDVEFENEVYMGILPLVCVRISGLPVRLSP